MYFCSCLSQVSASKATFVLSFSILLCKCLMNRLEKSALGFMAGQNLGGCLLENLSTICCCSLLEDHRVILIDKFHFC